jgi:hypothetical protein
MVNVLNGCENVSIGNHKELLQRDVCKPELQYISVADVITAATGGAGE